MLSRCVCYVDKGVNCLNLSFHIFIRFNMFDCISCVKCFCISYVKCFENSAILLNNTRGRPCTISLLKIIALLLYWRGRWSQSQLTVSERKTTSWTHCQSITEHVDNITTTCTPIVTEKLPGRVHEFKSCVQLH